MHDGERADERMRKHASKRAISLDSISRQVTETDFEEFDIIIAMDDSNIENLKSFNSYEEFHYKIHKMTDFAQNMNYLEVPDPYWGGEKGFELVLDIIEDSSLGLLKHLES